MHTADRAAVPPRAGVHAPPGEARDAWDALALVAHGVDVVIHRHNAVQLVVSLDAPYDATLGDRHVRGVTGFLIDSNVPHACQSARSTVLVTSVDATTRRGRVLKRFFSPGRPYVLVDELLPRATVAAFAADYARHRGGAAAGFDPLALLEPLCGPPATTAMVDPRVLHALGLIRDTAARPLRAGDVAAAIGVSERRMRVLLRAQLGTAFAALVLWTRIKRALGLMAAGDAELGRIAHAAGFADQAHFTRTFRRMFGLTPSALRRHGEFLHVFA